MGADDEDAAAQEAERIDNSMAQPDDQFIVVRWGHPHVIFFVGRGIASVNASKGQTRALAQGRVSLVGRL